MDTNKLKNNIRKFYAIQFFYALCFVIPVLVIYWQNNGLSLTEIMLLQSIFAISIVILEVPSGYFADMFGRKLSIIIGVIMWLTGNLIFAFGHGFLDFLIAELIFAIGCASLSGADTAFIYDTLKDLGRENEYKKIRGKITATSLITMAFAQVAGGFIANYGLPFGILGNVDNITITLFISLPLIALAIPFAFSLYEPKKHKAIIKKGYLKDVIITLKKEIFGKKEVLWMMGFFMILGASYSFALWFYQPYFQYIGLDLLYFGIIFGGFQIFSALISRYTDKIEKKLGFSYTIILSVILVIISYIGMGSVGTIRGLVFCFFQQFVRGIYGILSSDYIHHRISSKYRATIQSIQNLGKNIIYAIFLPIFGRAADIYSLSDSLLIIGITSTIILLPIIIILFRKQYIQS